MQTIIIEITRLYCLYFLEIKIRLSYIVLKVLRNGFCNITIALIENTIINFIPAVIGKQSNDRNFTIDIFTFIVT